MNENLEDDFLMYKSEHVWSKMKGKDKISVETRTSNGLLWEASAKGFKHVEFVHYPLDKVWTEGWLDINMSIVKPGREKAERKMLSKPQTYIYDVVDDTDMILRDLEIFDNPKLKMSKDPDHYINSNVKFIKSVKFTKNTKTKYKMT